MQKAPIGQVAPEQIAQLLQRIQDANAQPGTIGGPRGIFLEPAPGLSSSFRRIPSQYAPRGPVGPPRIG